MSTAGTLGSHHRHHHHPPPTIKSGSPDAPLPPTPIVGATGASSGGRTISRIKETEYHLHQMIFESLSTLDRLTILDMGGSSDGSSGDAVLEFRLDCGLGELARLQELRIVEFHHGSKSEHKQRLEMKDIEWMIDNWKRLTRIGGCLNRSSGIDVQLKEVLRWRVIDRDLVSNGGPSDDAIYKHQRLVHDLLLYGSSIRFMNLPNLRKLHVESNSDDEMDYIGNGETIHWDLTEKYPLLDDLTIRSVNVGPSLCRAISEHPSIRRLSLGPAYVEIGNLSTFWEACRNLERLSLTEIDSEDGSMPVPKDAVFNRMLKLTLNGVELLSPPEQLNMALRCPRLETFEWYPLRPIKVRMLINHPMQRDRWPQLDELRIPPEPQDAELASILEGISGCFGKATFFRAWSGTFGPMAFKALCFHLTILVHLRLDYCISVASSTIRDVLCSCPNLEILYVRTIYARDITEGGPWICQQLCELGICIRFEETEQDLHSLVFERLSTLVRLTTLDMKGSIYDYNSSGGVLEFRLDYGLGQLASLHALRVIRFHTKIEQAQQLGTKDVEWMIDNWKLKGIYGHLNRNLEVEAQLKGILNFHGIATSP
ncbi:MAG: hypothetical protein J3Q66DRAFT_445901 [Benniella sp.]|nr:MAG: hypothetical protein J3Q66DRAFT_445901 [Benniella sp.]